MASPRDPRNTVVKTLAVLPPTAGPRPTWSVDVVFVSRNGGVMIAGWLDDTFRPLEGITIIATGWRLTLDADTLARRRRPDVEQALGRSDPHAFGFTGFVFAGRPLWTSAACEVEIRLRDGGAETLERPLQVVEDAEIRKILLSQLVEGGQHGSDAIASIASLDRGLGDEILALNRDITSTIVSSPYVERFGSAPRRCAGSIIVCLYGRDEYLFLQNALFSGKAGIDAFEFIYVSNSPELAEPLLDAARGGHEIYGVSQTVIVLPGNAGFGAANNAAVGSACSDRVLFVNPDVFPRDRDWAQKHIDIVIDRPRAETALFGAPLYYDDGSLMHGGMFFEADMGVTFDAGRAVQWRLLRVEHYGKGASPSVEAFVRPRPVPAVTGAFISAERSWFEKLGGFSDEFVFGHYEDADLCLKSIEAGTPPWLHDLRLWHLEGKGSTRRPEHEGGALVNRWYFSSRWGGLVTGKLLGRAPVLPPPASAPPDTAGAAEPAGSEPTPAATPASKSGSAWDDGALLAAPGF
ncbi:MAG TPA: hypothetical protein VGS12_05550 [Caulobacteraceae bacterium]|nr:hypothetical protein [Caulobacteraceae bacterium]